MDNRNGFVLIMILALIVLAALLLTSLAGKSTRLAYSAREAEHQLQCKWLAVSAERSLLQRAAYLFASTNFEDFASDERCRKGPTLSATFDFGRYSVDLVLADEQSKVNLNHLQQSTGSLSVRGAILTALDCTPRPRPLIDLRPDPAARNKTSPATAYTSWSQLLGLSDFRPKEALGVLHTSRSLTLWGDGRINIHRAHEKDIRLAVSNVLGPHEVEQLLQMRQAAAEEAAEEAEEEKENTVENAVVKIKKATVKAAERSAEGAAEREVGKTVEKKVDKTKLEKMVNQLDLNEQQREKILTCITDESSCFSLWTVVRSGSREYYQLGIIQQAKRDATQTNATPVDGLPGTESELQPVRHFLW